MESYLPSLLELFRIIESRGINKNDIIDVLKIINTGQIPYLQKKGANLTDGVHWLENEIRKKELIFLRAFLCLAFPAMSSYQVHRTGLVVSLVLPSKYCIVFPLLKRIHFRI